MRSSRRLQDTRRRIQFDRCAAAAVLPGDAACETTEFYASEFVPNKILFQTVMTYLEVSNRSDIKGKVKVATVRRDATEHRKQLERRA